MTAQVGHTFEAEEGFESCVEAATELELAQPLARYCQEHHTAFRQHSRGENVWWSHKTADGKWCREK